MNIIAAQSSAKLQNFGYVFGNKNGDGEFSQPEWETRISVLLAFKLDHLQPVKLLFSHKISNFFTFILGSQFLLPQREKGWKCENGILPTWLRHSVARAFKLDHLQPVELSLFKKKFRIHNSSNLSETEGFQCLGRGHTALPRRMNGGEELRHSEEQTDSMNIQRFIKTEFYWPFQEPRNREQDQDKMACALFYLTVVSSVPTRWLERLIGRAEQCHFE